MKAKKMRHRRGKTGIAEGDLPCRETFVSDKLLKS